MTSGRPANDASYRLLRDVRFGQDVVVHSFTNLYGCCIGDGTRIGPFVEIQGGSAVGARCKIQSHTFIPEGVTICDEVFIGHGVMFINDRRPAATNASAELADRADWELLRTEVELGASIGSGAVVGGGVRIGSGAMVGAGAVVMHDVAPGVTVAGVPARVIRAASDPARSEAFDNRGGFRSAGEPRAP
jgi:acetyltransferase-like isoleucine patch superfamily enzyme